MKKNKCTIGIIGFGRFGTLAASVLSRHAKVKVYHFQKRKEDFKKARMSGAELASLPEVSQCDIVILTAPIVKTKNVIKEISSLVKPGSLVIDTCSVKVEPCQWLKKYFPKNVQIMGTHPMFGPVTTKFDLEKQKWNLKNLQIILCPLRIEKGLLKKIEKFLEKLGLVVIFADPLDHDRQNAKTLSLVHFLGRALNQAKIGPQKIFTPGYTDLLRIMPHTNGDDWQLFFDMNNYNRSADKVRKNFLDSCRIIEEKIEKSRTKNDFDFQRRMIDKIDTEILELLSRRFSYAARIGRIKKKKGLAIVDRKREGDIIEKRIKNSKLEEKFIRDLYALIFKESYEKQ